MSQSLLILGAGGHGKVVADIARSAGWTVVGFVDTDASKVGTEVIDDLTVVMSQDELVEKLEDDNLRHAVTFAFGNNTGRLKLLGMFAAAHTPTLIHATASISPSAALGAGTQVSPQAVVHPMAIVGEAVILNTGCIVEHDCHIHDGVHISPGAVLAGGVTVGARTWIGANATIINNISIGHDVTIGAGTVVIRDVPDGVTVVGNPGRIIKRLP